MKTNTFLLILFLTLLFENNLQSKPTAYNGDVLKWVVAVKACPSGKAVNIWVYNDAKTIASVGGFLTSNVPSTSEFFYGSTSCTSALYDTLDFDYDNKPTSLEAKINDEPGKQLVGTFSFSDYIKTGPVWGNASNSTNKLSTQLRLWHTNNVTATFSNPKYKFNDKSFCGDDILTLNNINFLHKDEILKLKVYDAGGALINTIDILPNSTSFPNSRPYTARVDEIFPPTYAGDGTFVITCVYFFNPSTSGYSFHIISTEKTLGIIKSPSYPRYTLEIEGITAICSDGVNKIERKKIDGLGSRNPPIRFKIYDKEGNSDAPLKDTVIYKNTKTIISDIGSGTYYYKYNSEDYCNSNEGTVIVPNKPTPISSVITPNDEKCVNSHNGEVIIKSISGGVVPYTSALTYDSSATKILKAKEKYTYNIWVTANIPSFSVSASSNPMQSCNFSIVSPTGSTVFNVNGYSNNKTIANPAQGIWQVILSGATVESNWTISSKINFLESTSPTTFFGNLYPKTYTLTIKDKNNCTKAYSKTIKAATPIKIDTTNTTAPKCKENLSDGSASITFDSKGSGTSYDYYVNGAKWSSVSGNIISGLDKGDKSIYVKDNNTCQSNTIVVPIRDYTNVPVIEKVDNDSAKCYGGKGRVTVTATNNCNNYKLGMTNSLTNTIDIEAGTYNLEVSNGDGCKTSYSNDVIIKQPEKITFDAASVNLTCNQNLSGKVMFSNVKGGNGGYSYFVDDISKSSTVEGLSAGEHDMFVQDSKYCVSDTKTINLIEPDPISLTFEKVLYPGGKDVSCAGNSDGRIKRSISGGVAPYYDALYPSNENFPAVNNNGTEYTFTSLGFGSYSLIGNDNNNCSFSSSEPITIGTSPDSLKIDSVTAYEYESGDNIKCYGENNGTIYIKFSGGTKPYFVTIAENTTKNIYNNYKSIKVNGTDTSFTGFIAGTYSISLTDTNNCYADNKTITLVQPNALSVSINSPKYKNNNFFRCYDEPETVIATANEGGRKGYQYSWNDQNYSVLNSKSLTYKDIIDTNNGNFNYYVYAQDTNGCTASILLKLTQPSKLEITPTLTIPTCYYDVDGMINIQASGGILDIMDFRLFLGNDEVGSFINSTDSNVLFNKLNGKNYQVKMYDGNNCFAETNILNITNPDTIRVFIDSVKIPSCFGGDDAILKLRGENGKKIGGENYKFKLWDSDAKFPEAIFDYNDSSVSAYGRFTGLSSIQYAYSIEDQIGCKDVNSYIINTPQKMVISKSDIPNICFEDHKAKLIIRADSGYGAYKFAYKYLGDSVGFSPTDTSDILLLENLNWNKHNTDSVINYKIYLRDAHFVEGQEKCTVSEIYSLPVVPRIKFGISPTNPSCHDDNNGAISLFAITGGTGPQSYWSYYWKLDDSNRTFNNSTSISNLTAGSYNIKVKDSLGCSVEQNGIVLSNPQKFIARCVSTTPDTGTGGAVFYQLNGLGTELKYKYFIDNDLVGYDSESMTDCVPESPIFSGLKAGKHSITFISPNGCVAKDSFRIYHLRPLIALINTQPAGIGASNGMAYVKASRGTESFKFFWHKSGIQLPISSQTAKGLSKGLYSVYAIDTDSVFTDTLYFEISETEQLSVAIDSISNTTCYAAADGYASVNVNGLHTPFSFKWIYSVGDSILPQNNSSQNFANNLSVGNYSVEVVDSVGSKVVKEFVISAGRPVTISSFAKIKNVSCFGFDDGLIEISAFGGSSHYDIIWENGATGQVANNLKQGNYSVKVIDQKSSQCETTKSFTITEPKRLYSIVDTLIKPVCYKGANGSIEVSSFGGTSPYRYEWPDISASFNKVTNLNSGTYKVKVTDAHNCIFDTLVTLPDTLPIEIFKVVDVMPLCYGQSNGSLNVMLKNGLAPYLISWPGLGKNIQGSVQNNLSSGNYVISAIDANGCKFMDTLSLAQPTMLTMEDYKLQEPLCHNSYNGSVLANISGGTIPYRYFWNNTKKNSSLNDSIAQGAYQLTIKDRNLCVLNKTFILNAPSKVSYSIVPKEPTCFGLSNGMLSIKPHGGTPGYKFSIDDMSKDSIIKNLPSKKFYISVKDSRNCKTDTSITLNQPSALYSNFELTNEIKCAGNCEAGITIKASGGTIPYSVKWPDSNTSFSRNDLCAGDYKISVSDANSCLFNLPFAITEPNPMVMLSYNAILPTCYLGDDGKLTASFFGGVYPYTKTWSNGSVGDTAFNLKAGNYTIVVKDANNCGTNKVLTLPEQRKEPITNIPEQIKMCENQVKTLNPGIWSSCIWQMNGATISKENTYTVNAAGNYKLNVVSLKGCLDSINFSVEYVKNLLHADFLLSQDAIVNEEVEIIDITWPMPENITWTYNLDSVDLLGSSNDRQRILFKYPGEYNIKLIAQSSSCTDSTTQTINVYSSENEQQKGERPVNPDQDILGLTIFPNPNSGVFTSNLILKEPRKITVEIVSIVSGLSIYKKDYDGSDNYSIPINIAYQSSGVYCLIITTPNQRKQFLFVIL